ncbi:Glu-tRNA(Gln) amidotransferase subunit GatD [Desulfurococcus amylolyticus]|uniref:Glu-tRNA(Gln) amidotransferase subunit GatD n=1 Tax=Desulfurococcus amylolyticus TaxID=94694 RepID=UPI0023F49FB7|nr:Glu-tRNA(Gln) amidotransferase subunit GatD [Desulfurococcus amylolyticus]
MELYYGYSGNVARILRSIGVEPGDKIVVVLKDGTVFNGILMPRQVLYSGRPVLVLKLDNGYNIGLNIDEVSDLRPVSKKQVHHHVGVEAVGRAEGLPRIVLLGTGGTIASKVDYETGAVTPVLTPGEILEWVPELAEIAVFNAREVMSIFSEDIEPLHWENLSREVYKELVEGVDGVVIAHGTDMMSYSASALAFSIVNKPAPIVFVGSQRSSDRPSSDSAFNLRAAFIAASKGSFAESVIVMHGETSDTYALVHRGVKARKMHTSRRDAFQSINDKPIAKVYPETMEVRIVGRIIEHRGKNKEAQLKNKFDDRVALVKVYPGLQPEVLETLIDKGFHGIVLEGSGLGHMPNKLIPVIARAVENDIPVVMTSQCLFGRVNLYVYSTGRRLLEAGVIPGSDILPETAYVKLSWILGSVSRDLEEVRKVFLTNLAGEFNERHILDLYPRWNHE